MEKVFVYGTLRRGESNHSLLAPATCLAMTARMKGCLIDTGDGYPGLLEEDGEVIGELYEVSDAELGKLDELEDYFGPDDPGNLYNRVEVDVCTDRGSVKAWTYFYNRNCEGRHLLRFSDWKAYRMGKTGGA
ncbi:gamma-glutamylcyclotransferase family protein [Paenibacillus harenae]|uniref:gamma-glutamylcyclotransferase family protein n=1 Tax=Paenibacillus harenae TaxID=306543 RepID=UPI0003F8A0F6|nr:gamma-glutamylcyclotransferase [Paenibacillus harenae]